jgi:hypothetical protein
VERAPVHRCSVLLLDAVLYAQDAIRFAEYERYQCLSRHLYRIGQREKIPDIEQGLAFSGLDAGNGGP